MPCSYPLCLFLEDTSRFSSSDVSSHGFCHACTVTVVIFRHLNNCFLLTPEATETAIDCAQSLSRKYLGIVGDKYSEEYQASSKKDPPDFPEDDEWENGNKSAAEEAIERVKEIVGRGKGLDESDEQR